MPDDTSENSVNRALYKMFLSGNLPLAAQKRVADVLALPPCRGEDGAKMQQQPLAIIEALRKKCATLPKP